MRRGKMKKWRVTAIALLMVMIFATPMSGLKVQAEESIQSEMANVDIVNGYMNVLQKRKHNVGVRRIRRIVSVAAGVVLPLLAVVLWYGTMQKPGDVPEQVASVIRHGEVKAELVLADGTILILSLEGSHL